MTDIEIEIDGQTLKAKPTQTVIQVADEAGIYIPRFCYHKHLSIPANCRMCLVEVEKAPKALPACATPCTPGMKVFTKSSKTIAAQRAVMEFLLINHPLDCPICDQGGECELQDLAVGYGASDSEYNETKRAIADDNLGPLVATEMTRCIFCTRCIRFGQEIAGMPELGMTYRGEYERVTTFVQQALHSEVSGNIIDLCPVGALTSRPYRFTARPWELDQAPSISPHDCLGTNINVHVRYGDVMRVVSRENNAINQTWISDRDRFSYTALNHAERLTDPMIRVDGEWRVVDWQEALTFLVSGLEATLLEQGKDQLGALISPTATLEEFYLLQKIIRGLGSPHIDHRLREVDQRDQHLMPLFPGMSATLPELETCDAVLLIGSYLQREQPLAALRLRKAVLKGATVTVLNAIDHEFIFPVHITRIVAPHLFTETLSAIVKALDGDTSIDEATQAMAMTLKEKTNAIIFLGASALNHPEAATIRSLAKRIATLTGAKINYMTDGGNSAGGWIAGAIPHRLAGGKAINPDQIGLDAFAMLQQPRKAYVLLNVEPEFDTAHAALAREAMKQAAFVVALSIYRDSTLEANANIILPIAPFTESAGTYVNGCGDWQTVQGVAKSQGQSRPAWKVLRVIGNFLELDGFEYESSQAVLEEIKTIVDQAPAIEIGFDDRLLEIAPVKHRLTRVGQVPLYSIDSIVRRSQPLQKTEAILEGEMAAIRLHPETALSLKLNDGDMVRITQQACTIELPLILDARMALSAVGLFAGIAATMSLGDLYGDIQLEKV